MLAGYAPWTSESPYKTYKMILNTPLHFPRHFDAVTRDLLQRLLTQDRFRRLGCFRNGAKDVKAHKFFRDIDFDALLERQIQAPLVPRPRFDGDPSLFELYPNAEVHTTDPTEDVLKMFEDW
ncbi:hypothetical protein RCL1_005496 [Eukaryota sp. TZLM3-RCL]